MPRSNCFLNEDFPDSVCNGCSVSTNAGPQCQNFGWHTIGGFADVVTGLYAGQIQDSTLLGYDCGAASTEVSFPTVALPANATSCQLTFDLYMELDPADSGNCASDLLTVEAAVGNGPSTPLSGVLRVERGADQNPYPSSTGAGVVEMAFDLTDFAGDLLTLSFAFSSDANNNAGLGAIVDHVQVTCQVP